MESSLWNVSFALLRVCCSLYRPVLLGQIAIRRFVGRVWPFDVNRCNLDRMTVQRLIQCSSAPGHQKDKHM